MPHVIWNMQEHNIIDIISTITRKSLFFGVFQAHTYRRCSWNRCGHLLLNIHPHFAQILRLRSQESVQSAPCRCCRRGRSWMNTSASCCFWRHRRSPGWWCDTKPMSQEMGRVSQGDWWILILPWRELTVCGIILVSFCRVSKSCHWPFFLCLPSGMSESNHFPSVWTKFAEKCVFFCAIELDRRKATEKLQLFVSWDEWTLSGCRGAIHGQFRLFVWPKFEYTISPIYR